MREGKKQRARKRKIKSKSKKRADKSAGFKPTTTLKRAMSSATEPQPNTRKIMATLERSHFLSLDDRRRGGAREALLDSPGHPQGLRRDEHHPGTAVSRLLVSDQVREVLLGAGCLVHARPW